MTTEEIEAELERRRRHVVEGDLMFLFCSVDRARAWAERAMPLMESRNFVLAEPVFIRHSTGHVECRIPYVYTARSASRHDVARFAFQATGDVIREDQRARLHPLSFELTATVPRLA